MNNRLIARFNSEAYGCIENGIRSLISKMIRNSLIVLGLKLQHSYMTAHALLSSKLMILLLLTATRVVSPIVMQRSDYKLNLKLKVYKSAGRNLPYVKSLKKSSCKKKSVKKASKKSCYDSSKSKKGLSKHQWAACHHTRVS